MRWTVFSSVGNSWRHSSSGSISSILVAAVSRTFSKPGDDLAKSVVRFNPRGIVARGLSLRDDGGHLLEDDRTHGHHGFRTGSGPFHKYVTDEAIDGNTSTRTQPG